MLLGHFFSSIRRRINRLDNNDSGGRSLYKREDLRKSRQQLSLTLCLSKVPFFNCPLSLTLLKLKLKHQLKHFQVLRFRPLPIVWSSNRGSRPCHAHLLLLHRSQQKIHTFGEYRFHHCPWLNTFLTKKVVVIDFVGVGRKAVAALDSAKVSFWLINVDCDDNLLQLIAIDQLIVLFQVTVENCEFSQSEETETCVRWIWTQR